MAEVRLKAGCVARRGDVVFLTAPEGVTAKALDQAAEALFEKSGVQVVFVGGGAAPVGLIPLRPLRRKRGHTPRWLTRF